MAYFILGLLALLGLILSLNWFLNTAPAVISRYLRRAAIGAIILALLFLAATGRLHWLFALIGAVIPILLRLLPLLRLATGAGRGGKGQSAKGAGSAAGSNRSQVTTAFLHLELDHASGTMSGEVLAGRHRGRSLHQMSLPELTDLLSECRAADSRSATLLEAYLDRVHGTDWRDEPARDAGTGAVMDAAEAREILGLGPEAGPEEIVQAHRRLMQKLHPDRGGSDYLAAKINQAKDVLLGQ